jgi:hypothetical protein
MENHGLGIGTLSTDCRVIAEPGQIAALRATIERATSGPFAALLASAVEPVLERHEGVIRIRTIRLDLVYTGIFDDRRLAALMAAQLAAVLRQTLDRGSADIRAWPDALAYMASYVDMRLGFVHEPGWAFPDFEPLRLLSPTEAAIEIVKARPAVLLALAGNGRRSGHALRVVERLDAPAAKRLVVHLLQLAAVAPAASAQPPSPQLADIVVAAFFRTDAGGVDHAILRLICTAGASVSAQDVVPLILAAALAVAFAAIADQFERRHGHALSFSERAAAAAVAGEVLPMHLAEFANRIATQAFAAPVLARLLELFAKTPPHPGRRRHALPPEKRPGAAKPLRLASPLAGLALLLPDVVRLSLHRQLGIDGLRQSLLSILDAPARALAETDALVALLYPQLPDAGDPSFPPVSDLAIARLAPETRGLILSRQGAAGWGDLLLASFAGRLTGLRGSSRAYLQRQFLVVSGVAEFSASAVSITLDGPPLSIILKMAGLSGDQMPVPHLNNRRLILNLGGSR